MKFKLKDVDFNLIEYKLNQNKHIVENCSLINVSYNKEDFEFQTPKVIIERIIKENNKDYLLLKLIGNQACHLFFSKIFELEENINKSFKKEWFNNSIPISNIKPIFTGDSFTVKIPFKYSKPITKCYSNGSLFNYYSLLPGMEIICLLSLKNIWINFDNNVTYNLSVKEILVTK
jgi:hypothetical protein